MEVNMFTIRKLLSIAALLILTACSALPREASPTQIQAEKSVATQPEKSKPTPMPSKPGELTDSILGVLWKNNAEGHLLVPIDPNSGQALAKYEPISLGQSYSYAFSPDRRTLAMVGYVSNQHPNGGSLHLIDSGTWEDQVQELQLDAYVNAMAFSPDGEQLAIAYGNAESQVLTLDVSKPFVKSKTTVQETSLDFYVYSMKFNANGSGLMIYGSKSENPNTVNQMSPDPPVVVLLDSANLSIEWKTNLEGVHHGIVPKDENSEEPVDVFQPGQAMYLIPGLTFSPHGNILYVVHPSEDKLTSVDFDAQKVTTVAIKPQLSWFERLLSLGVIDAHAKVAEGTRKTAVISPDGQFLYVVGQRSELGETTGNETQVNNIPLGLQILRTKDGSQVAHYDTDAEELSISADGRYLYLRTWGVSPGIARTEIFDTSTDQIISRLEGMWLVPTHRLDGRPILGSSVWMNDKNIYHNSIVDPQDLSVLAAWDSVDTLAWLKTP
jgi:hypothetical protein